MMDRKRARKSYQTTAAIGKPFAGVEISSSAKKPSPLALAHRVTSWPIAMSYYDVATADADGRPSFEMSYRFHLNGVTSQFVIDHGDFAFNGTLSKLQFTAPAGCSAEKVRAQ